MHMVMGKSMRDNKLQEEHLFRLLSWLSPSFPVGAYAYSHGLEFAVETGAVSNSDELSKWIEAVILLGGGRNDAIFFVSAWHAGQDEKYGLILEIAERAMAHRSTAELALETEAQGSAFLRAINSAWENKKFDELMGPILKADIPIAYPVVVAVAMVSSGIPLKFGLVAYLHAFVSNLVSAGMRLIPLGQSAGQKVLSDLQGKVQEAAVNAENRTLDDLGSTAPVIDWASSNHETQYTRLFRS